MMHRVVLGFIAALALTSAATADGVDKSTQDRLDVLQAIQAAQDARIEELSRQVADAEASEPDALRMQALRDQVREILSEEEFRESLVPSLLQAGYDKGFFIRSTDNNFSMKMQWIMQFRWTHYGVNSRNRYLAPRTERDDSTGFDINRARLRIFGHAFDPNLKYFFSITHAANSNYGLRSIYAWMNYRFSDEFQVMLGQMRLASTRAQVSRITRYQLVDVPFTDAIFGRGVGIGARFWGKLFDKRLTYQLDVVNSFNGFGRTITTDPPQLDGNPGIILRAVWHALGDNPGKEFANKSDLTFHESPALDLGFHYHWNNDEGDLATSRIPVSIRRPAVGVGGFGRVPSNGLMTHTFGAEAAFQYRGFSAISEFHWTLVDVRRAGRRPFAPYWLATRSGGDDNFYGGYVQMGYMLPIPGFENKIEIAGRIEGLGGVDPGNQGIWMYTAGVNYFIKGADIKLQADISRIHESPLSSSVIGVGNVNDSALLARVQLSFAF